MAGEFAACHILVCYFEDKCNPGLKTEFFGGGSKGPYVSTKVGKKFPNSSQPRTRNGRGPSDRRLTARIHQDSHTTTDKRFWTAPSIQNAHWVAVPNTMHLGHAVGPISQLSLQRP